MTTRSFKCLAAECGLPWVLFTTKHIRPVERCPYCGGRAKETQS